MTIERPAGLSVLPQGYGLLFDRGAAAFQADPRVRGMWLHGALGRGAADAASDLDISLAVADDDFDAFWKRWPEWLAAITSTVLAKELAPGLFYAMTPTCERLDVHVERVSALARTPHRRRVLVFDRDGLDALIPAPEDPPPDPAAISGLVEELLRQAAMFPVIVVRADWLQGVVAVQRAQLLLYQLYVESNRPAAPSGMKQWSAKLTLEQRRELESLPVATPSLESVLAARAAALAVFVRDARLIAGRNDAVWPDELERAVRGYLDREGYPLPD